MASRDLADRENRVLREAKASLEAEIESTRRRFDSLTAEHNELLKSHALSISERNKEISELRADLKMKIFELTALGASFEVSVYNMKSIFCNLSNIFPAHFSVPPKFVWALVVSYLFVHSFLLCFVSLPNFCDHRIV